MSIRFAEMIDEGSNKPARSSEEIINNISNTLDFLGKENTEENERI